MLLKKYVNYASQSFSMPSVCSKLRTLLDDYRTDADDIARLINLDPSLAAKLLRLANSALFRFPSPIESVAKAVSVVGGEALYNLVIAETARSAFDRFATETINIDVFWSRSVTTATLARMLAKTSGLRGSERFFVMGLLHNLAELVIAKQNPQSYQAYLQLAADGDALVAQKGHFGFYFTECSALILEAWRLPVSLWQPMAHMHRLAAVRKEPEVAHLVAARMLSLACQNKETLPSVLAEALMLLGQDDLCVEHLEGILQQAEAETRALASLLSA